ncbi:MAG: hypothetical protein LBB81_10750 [Treponema sp.]|jgi:hypothetical protein|nr:hypothetical protein [Treponema sp.]
MIQETESSLEAAPNTGNRNKLLPVLICSGVSVFLVNSGFLSFFFLAPLGYAAVVYNNVWIVFAVSSAINFITALIIGAAAQTQVWMDIMYFMILSLGFAFLTDTGRFTRIRTLYRFILVSITASIVFLLVVIKDDSGFAAFINSQADLLSSILISPNVDVVTQSVLKQNLTPEIILGLIKNISLRGGALTGAFFLYFANMQISFSIVRIIKKQNHSRPLVKFFAPAQTIWVLSGALVLVLLSNILKIQTLELLSWNVLVICAIIFLAQGAGILSFMLSRRGPAFRLIASVVIFVAVFSPGLNTVILGAVILLGITENWVPFRRLKNDGQASTPQL